MASAALRSFGAHAPGAELVLLQVAPGPVPVLDGISVLAVDALLPPATLAAMRQRYTPAELCFALKPFLIGALLAAGHDQVHYVDADCQAYASLAPLIADLAVADVLLTPHSLSPIPDDGRTPAALTVLRSGVFNGGYIGVRNTAAGRAFAHWLAAMTERQAHNRPDDGMCGDQRWLDLVPVLFPGLAICRRPGANVAYWNLHERALGRDADGRYTVSGEPLMFFHFSGHDPRQPAQLSRHQNRHAVIDGEPLQLLLHDYGERLRAAQAFPAAEAAGRGRLRALKAMLRNFPQETRR